MSRLSNQAYHDKYGATSNKGPDITVYFLQASRSIRTCWVLEELGIDYKLEFADRVNQKAPPEFKEKCGNPLGKFPTIKDGDTNIYESGAITEYLCENYDVAHKLIPENQHLRTKVQIWMHAAEATFMLHALPILYTRWNGKDYPDAVAAIEKGLSANVQNDFNWLEGELGRSTGRFIVGDNVTAADIMMQLSVRFIIERELGTKGGSWPRIQEWLERCENTDSYKKAVEKSGHTLYPKTT